MTDADSTPIETKAFLFRVQELDGKRRTWIGVTPRGDTVTARTQNKTARALVEAVPDLEVVVRYKGISRPSEFALSVADIAAKWEAHQAA